MKGDGEGGGGEGGRVEGARVVEGGEEEVCGYFARCLVAC